MGNPQGYIPPSSTWTVQASCETSGGQGIYLFAFLLLFLLLFRGKFAVFICTRKTAELLPTTTLHGQAEAAADTPFPTQPGPTGSLGGSHAFLCW